MDHSGNHQKQGAHQEMPKQAEHNEHKSQEHADNGQHHQMMIKDFKKRFLVSLIITIPVLILSPLIQNFLSLEISFTGDKYLLFILSVFIFFFGGWPFLKGLID